MFKLVVGGAKFQIFVIEERNIIKFRVQNKYPNSCWAKNVFNQFDYKCLSSALVGSLGRLWVYLRRLSPYFWALSWSHLVCTRDWNPIVYYCIIYERTGVLIKKKKLISSLLHIWAIITYLNHTKCIFNLIGSIFVTCDVVLVVWTKKLYIFS